MDFYDEVGPVVLGSRLRRLSETVTAGAARIFAAYDVGLDPRWFPVFYLLARRGATPVTQIARAIGHSHASVSQIVGEMKARRLVLSARDHTDGRVSVVRLSAAGRKLVPALESQCRDVGLAVEELLAETGCSLWTAIAETEHRLEQHGLPERVREIRNRRAREGVVLAEYAPRHRRAFARLNRQWIEQHWDLEEADRRVLDDPEGQILAPGGFIVLALRGGRAIGTCAMLKADDTTYELAKMAVTDAEKGKGIGRLLATGAIDRARGRGARRIYLESNTLLEPAIGLYRALGFCECVGGASPYARCNIQMELMLD